MKELVVISGKGGTGKTSIVASFAAISNKSVLADCDVDAADLHLVLEPQILNKESFSGGKRARIISELCTACGKCKEVCQFGAVDFNGPRNEQVNKTYKIDPIACEGCGVCAWFCEDNAIEFGPAVNGEWYISQTRHGPMVHAKLGIAEENSGKLVTLVRKEARKLAEKYNLDFIISDGSPGIGCPVIASITGADLVLIVTEPTLSGLHDLNRVADLTRHFKIPAMVCINKWDINDEITLEIEEKARNRGLTVAGRVRYERAVTEAMVQKQSVVEYKKDGCAEDIKNTWSFVLEKLNND